MAVIKINNHIDTSVYAPTFEELKSNKIKALHEKYDADYQAYLDQYPKREVASFEIKQSEATAYRIDNTAPTPTIDAMVGGDTTKRVALIDAILAKVDFLAQQEGIMIAKRDAIKACTTQEELDAIEI